MLTQLAILAAKPKAKPYKLSDGGGLYLLIETGGSKLWRFRYRFDSKEKMLSLGAFPDVTLATARTKRDEARTVLASGVDPARKREQECVAASVSAANTFGVTVSEYIARLESEGMSESTISKNKWLLRHLAAPLANRPVAEANKIVKLHKQARAIEDAFLLYGQVNVTDAWNGVYGGMKIRRLGARIWELRDAGYAITAEELSNGECYYKLISKPGEQMPLL